MVVFGISVLTRDRRLYSSCFNCRDGEGRSEGRRVVSISELLTMPLWKPTANIVQFPSLQIHATFSSDPHLQHVCVYAVCVRALRFVLHQRHLPLTPYYHSTSVDHKLVIKLNTCAHGRRALLHGGNFHGTSKCASCHLKSREKKN